MVCVYVYSCVKFIYVFVWFTCASVFIWFPLYGLGCMCILYVCDLQLLLRSMLGEEYDRFQDVYVYVFASVLFTGVGIQVVCVSVCVYVSVCFMVDSKVCVRMCL